MSVYQGPSIFGKGNLGASVVERVMSGKVVIDLSPTHEVIKEGLLAWCVRIGLKVLEAMMEQEITEKVGPKGKHNKNRKGYRHGYDDGEVVLGGRKAHVRRPRARTLDNKEIPLETYAVFRRIDLLEQAAFERMLHGLACRRYEAGLEEVGELEERGTSKSSVSRRFVKLTAARLQALLNAPLNDLDLVVVYIDGIAVGEHTIVAALGVDMDGKKHVLGLWEGATENAAVCRALLTNLVERGLDPSRGLLVVIDGSKALRKAVRDVLGPDVPVQRCQVHKERNVLDHLPKEKHSWVRRKLREAWAQPDAESAEAALRALADLLEKEYPGAAASLREGLEETLTVRRLQVSERLQRSLRSTNPLESAISGYRRTAGRVARWCNGEQALRWTAAGLLEAETRFRRIAGYRELPLLRAAILRLRESQPTEAIVSA